MLFVPALAYRTCIPSTAPTAPAKHTGYRYPSISARDNAFSGCVGRRAGSFRSEKLAIDDDNHISIFSCQTEFRVLNLVTLSIIPILVGLLDKNGKSLGEEMTCGMCRRNCALVLSSNDG